MLPITQSKFSPDIIDLGAGEPNQAVFPLEMIRRAAEERFAQGDPSFLQYGIEQGDGYFRLALAQFLSRGYGQPTNPENIFVTAGVSSALDFIPPITAIGRLAYLHQNKKAIKNIDVSYIVCVILFS